MQVEDVNVVGSELFETSLQALRQVLGLVLSGVLGVAFGGESQTALPPFGLARESLLLTADICSGSVDLIIALGLEVV